MLNVQSPEISEYMISFGVGLESLDVGHWGIPT